MRVVVESLDGEFVPGVSMAGRTHDLGEHTKASDWPGYVVEVLLEVQFEGSEETDARYMDRDWRLAVLTEAVVAGCAANALEGLLVFLAGSGR